jgi:hypothetical protein
LSASFRLAGDWLSTCDKHHDRCPKLLSSELPTRVIDVSPTDGSTHPKLYITQGERSTYATLSYCWGQKQELVLSSDNLESFQKRLPYEKLPKTLRHAIVCIKRLRIRYLWIDSLCIIQDSAEDKEAEIASMVDVFGRAYVTLQAAISSHCQEGFLLSRQISSHISLPFLCPDSRVGTIQLRKIRGAEITDRKGARAEPL